MTLDHPSVAGIAEALGARFTGGDRVVEGIATLSSAVGPSLTFVTNVEKYAEPLVSALAAGAVVLAPEEVDARNGAVIVVDNPRGAFALAVTRFFTTRPPAGIAATAVIHPTAIVSSSASIGEFTVIGEGVTVGGRTEVRNHVVLGARVVVGDDCLIKSHAVIGEEGFGVDKDVNGNNLRLPHLGSVILGNSVEIGAFTTVCSGTIDPTTVGDFSKIDDHVHISHNVRVGRNVIITATAEVSGSVVIGDEAWIGPNASVIQGIIIGRNALIGMGAVVTKAVPENEVQFGNPAKRLRDRD